MMMCMDEMTPKLNVTQRIKNIIQKTTTLTIYLSSDCNKKYGGYMLELVLQHFRPDTSKYE